MSIVGSVGDKRRKSRNILLLAFIILVVLWIFKLSHPRFSLFQAYSNVSSSSTPVEYVKDHGIDSNARWKTRIGNPEALSTDIFNGTVSNKAAVIIETRFRTNIIPLILHFSSVLGYSWPIISMTSAYPQLINLTNAETVYTTPEASGQFTTSAALSRYLMSKTIQIRTLPQTVFFDSSDSVSKFMTGRWLWENLAPAEHILVFQSDSMLCANAARSVEDFFEYDFVGPPVASDIGKEYNGGLSIRKRTTVLRILDEWNWEETKTDEDRFEDQWYFNRLVERLFGRLSNS
jgi:hypothetical protein